mgnify:CR=1 FL=1
MTTMSLKFAQLFALQRRLYRTIRILTWVGDLTHVISVEYSFALTHRGQSISKIFIKRKFLISSVITVLRLMVRIFLAMRNSRTRMNFSSMLEFTLEKNHFLAATAEEDSDACHQSKPTKELTKRVASSTSAPSISDTIA